MKDRQVSRKPDTAHIPVLSPFLHVLAMPALVLLRHDFGYLFLRPKSIFMALIWAFVLFSIYTAWEPDRWRANAPLCWFLAVSSLAYLFHLTRSIISQWGRAPHDQFAGRTILFPFRGREGVVFLIVEPVLTVVAGIAVSVIVPSGGSLFRFLLWSAVAMFLKEGINQWAKVRKVKHQLDATADAEESMTKVMEERDSPLQKRRKKPVSSRRPRERRVRVRVETDEDEALEKHAAALRMLPPYTLEKAEENYRTLVRELFPDEVEQSAKDHEEMIQLTDARDFFRRHFGNH